MGGEFLDRRIDDRGNWRSGSRQSPDGLGASAAGISGRIDNDANIEVRP